MDNLAENLKQQFRPAARQLGEIASAYAERVIANLEAINDSIQSEEFVERRHRAYITLTGGSSRLLDIPQYEEWQLELIAVVPAAASNVEIRGSGMLVFARTYAERATDYGIGGIIQGGTQIAITATANTELYIQFKVSIPEKAKRARDRGDKRRYGPVDRYNEPERHLQAGLDLETASAGGLDVGGNNA